jgi:CubicO group peptidase (beta-lactamase class C family)
MNSWQSLQSAVTGLLLLIAAPSVAGLAVGTFDIRAGAHFNPQKLERIGEYFQNEIATGKIPGAIILIQQHGQLVFLRSFGVRDVTSKLPITPDTIFRIFSMTKPITSVAAMMLIDQGKVALGDPVAKYIPSFANLKVGVEKKLDNGERSLELVPLRRPMTIEDLMQQTSGITYGFYGDSLVRKAGGTGAVPGRQSHEKAVRRSARTAFFLYPRDRPHSHAEVNGGGGLFPGYPLKDGVIGRPACG